MKSIFKKVLLLCLFVTCAVAVGLFAACDNGNDDKGKDTTVTYTVLVEDETHAPVKGVSVVWSKGGTRYDAVATGDDGKASMELAPDTYSISLVAATLPDGYSAPTGIEVTKDKTTETVTLIKDFRYTVKLVNEDGTPFYHEKVMLAICEREGTNCLSGSFLGTDGVWTYYDAEPGDYKVQIQFPEDIEGMYTFTGSDAGQYYTGGYFSATETEMTITLKAVSSQLTVTAAGTYKVTVKSAAEYATIIFTPATTGVYEICSEGSFDTRVEYSASTQGFYKADEEDDDSGEGKNFKLGGFEVQEVGQGYQYRIYVKEGATFPATFTVKFVRTGDASATVKRVYTKVTPTELGTTAYPDGNGVLKSIDTTVKQTAVKGTDGFYHLGTAEGPVLVAKLASYGFTDMQEGGYVVTFIDLTDETKGWDYIDFWKAYTELCNEDGVYPVNDEIKLMLERWADQWIKQYKNQPNNPNANVADGSEWLLPCGYYDEASTPPVESDDVIIGEYIGDNGTLTVKADGTLTFTDIGSNNGTWKKNEDGSYTFTQDFGFEEAIYKVTRAADGTLTLYDEEYDETLIYKVASAETDVIVGEYLNEEEYKLTVLADGTYTITEDGMLGPNEIESGTWVKNSENNYTFTYVSFMTGTYTVTRDAQGTLTFMEDLEEPAEEPMYVFEALTKA